MEQLEGSSNAMRELAFFATVVALLGWQLVPGEKISACANHSHAGICDDNKKEEKQEEKDKASRRTGTDDDKNEEKKDQDKDKIVNGSVADGEKDEHKDQDKDKMMTVSLSGHAAV